MASDDDSADKTMVIRPSAAGKRQPPPKARLTCVDVAVLKGGPGAEIRLDSVEITVGRASSNAVMLKADGISRVHARIFPGDGKWGIEDLKSTNGVRVNNSKIEQAWLEPGDTVAIGRVCYKYTLERDEKPAATPTQIDLGDYEKTVVMRPGARPAEAAAPSAAPAAEPAKPGPGAKPAPAAAPKPAAPRASTPPRKSRALLWIVIGALVVLGALVAAFLA